MKQEIIEEFNSYLMQGKVEKGLNFILREIGEDNDLHLDLTFLKSSLQSSEKNNKLGLITNEQFNIANNQITYSVIKIKNIIGGLENPEIEYKSIIEKPVDQNVIHLKNELLIRRQIERLDQEWDKFVEKNFHGIPSFVKIIYFIVKRFLLYTAITVLIFFIGVRDSDDLNVVFLLFMLLLFLNLIYRIIKYFIYIIRWNNYKKEKKKLDSSIGKLINEI